jgi:CheY-like chemotaxis protein
MAQRKTILIVDDSPTVRAQIAEALSEEFECITAVDGMDGLTLALSSRPAAIVADLEMPEMNGTEMFRRLRADPRTKEIPVIIATTVMAVDKVNECRALGCAGFVLKPIEKEYLVAKLKNLVAKR